MSAFDSLVFVVSACRQHTQAINWIDGKSSEQHRVPFYIMYGGVFAIPRCHLPRLLEPAKDDEVISSAVVKPDRMRHKALTCHDGQKNTADHATISSNGSPRWLYARCRGDGQTTLCINFLRADGRPIWSVSQSGRMRDAVATTGKCLQLEAAAAVAA